MTTTNKEESSGKIEIKLDQNHKNHKKVSNRNYILSIIRLKKNRLYAAKYLGRQIAKTNLKRDLISCIMIKTQIRFYFLLLLFFINYEIWNETRTALQVPCNYFLDKNVTQLKKKNLFWERHQHIYPAKFPKTEIKHKGKWRKKYAN